MNWKEWLKRIDYDKSLFRLGFNAVYFHVINSSEIRASQENNLNRAKDNHITLILKIGSGKLTVTI